MDLSVSSWSFHRALPNTPGWEVSGEIDLPAFVHLCREQYATQGVEVVSTHVMRPEDEAYVSDLRACVQEAGLVFVNLACDAGKVGVAGPEARKEHMDTLRRWIETAAALGSFAIRVNAAGAQGRSDEEALEAVVRDYLDLVPAAKDLGLFLLLENHGGLTADPEMVVRIFKGVGDEIFRACPDNGNFAPQVREAGLRAMVPYMAMAHLKTLAFDADGNETTFDIPAIVALYREAGFDGFLSIEFEGEGDQYEGTRKSVALARRAIEA